MSNRSSRSQILLARALSPWRLGSIVATVAIAVALGACDPTHDITYENETNEFIEIYTDGFLNVSLDPLQKRTLSTIKFRWLTFEARNAAGNVLYRQTFSWDELRHTGWRIVVTDDSSIDPQPTPHVRATPTALPP